MAFDVCHEQIVRALEKAGWTVEKQQAKLNTTQRQVFVDILAERGLNGSRQQIMLVEIKCFPDRDSTTQELYVSIGQYLIYRAVIAELDLTIPLYLAVPDDAFRDIFDSTARRVLQESRIKMVVVNLETETITQWIE